MNSVLPAARYCMATAAEEVGGPLAFAIADYLSSPDLWGFCTGLRVLQPLAEGCPIPYKWEEESRALLSSGGSPHTPGCPPTYSHFSNVVPWLATKSYLLTEQGYLCLCVLK